ncbi:MAG: cyclic nucleotide-binding domain-containing protein [Deltaproteobacteria bacterium]|nr:MAG: cyclic nucleotide-binding domain-containing protein [Deltaproteobacteria bacterium]
MRRFYLGLEKGLFEKSIYPLEGSMTIGRSAENDIGLADRTVSRSHARVSFQRDVWMIEDLGSANGILFGGERVVKRALEAGDSFQIGEVSLRFIEDEASEEAELLSETMRTFGRIIKYQSTLLERYRSKLGFMRLKESFLSTPVFKSLGDRELRELSSIANLHLFNSGEVIIRKGDPGRSVFIILDGQVRVFTEDYYGKEFELATLADNSFFGEMSLLTGEPRSSSVKAVKDSLLSEISYSIMRRLMLRYPEVKNVMLEYFHERVQDSKKKQAVAGIEERRRHPRLSERLLVRFTVSPAPTLPEAMISHTYKGTSADISISGMQLVVMGPAMEAFCSGCELHLAIELPIPWGKVHTLGAIRRVIPGEHTVHLGINFFNIPTQDENKLREFIYGKSHLEE